MLLLQARPGTQAGCVSQRHAALTGVTRDIEALENSGRIQRLEQMILWRAFKAFGNSLLEPVWDVTNFGRMNVLRCAVNDEQQHSSEPSAEKKPIATRTLLLNRPAGQMEP